MNPPFVWIIACLFVLIFASGFWLRGARRPLPVGKLTLHKLLALAALALLGLALRAASRASGLDAGQQRAAIVCGVFFVTAIAGGGLVSLDRPPAPAVRALHWTAPFLTLLAAAWLLWQLG